MHPVASQHLAGSNPSRSDLRDQTAEESPANLSPHSTWPCDIVRSYDRARNEAGIRIPCPSFGLGPIADFSYIQLLLPPSPCSAFREPEPHTQTHTPTRGPLSDRAARRGTNTPPATTAVTYKPTFSLLFLPPFSLPARLHDSDWQVTVDRDTFLACLQ